MIVQHLIKIPQNFVLLWWIFKNRWHLLIPIFISLLNDLMKQSTQLFGVPLRTTSWVSEFLFVWIERTSAGLMFFRLSAIVTNIVQWVDSSPLNAACCIYCTNHFKSWLSSRQFILHCCFNKHHFLHWLYKLCQQRSYTCTSLLYMYLSRPWWFKIVGLIEGLFKIDLLAF